MFNQLTERLESAFKRLRGMGKITESNIEETLKDIRIALLEADVALPAITQIIDDLKEKALGEVVLRSLTPGQTLVKIVNDILIRIMGEYNDSLNLKAQSPAVILVAGLQGSGKTTTVAKLAKWLQKTENSQIIVASCDVYRPAAIEQLQRLASSIDIDFFPSHANDDPVTIAKQALKTAKQRNKDILILDTAGRLHIDADMMAEIQAIHEAVEPIETLFIVDSMTGQDAANTAKAFNNALPLTGVILSKTDGDSRGGAALSIRHITGKPIKFLGTGEKTDALEPFHPDRLASRILGMGDIVSLVEQAQASIDLAKAEKTRKKLTQGLRFDLQDYLEQLEQLDKMGGMANLLSKLPMAGKLPAHLGNQMNDDKSKYLQAMIKSMTPKERRFPATIKGSRKVRIAKGSGTSIQDVNRLLKQFEQMEKMMKKISRVGMNKMMEQMQKIMPHGGQFP